MNVETGSPLPLPEDREALHAFVQSLLREREQHQQQTAALQHQMEEQQKHLVAQQRRTEEQQQQAVQLQAEILRLQVELDRYKKWYYGPRADRLRTPNELAQLLLQFAEELDQKPVLAVDSELSAEPLARRVQRRKGRRDLARFENLPDERHFNLTVVLPQLRILPRDRCRSL